MTSRTLQDRLVMLLVACAAYYVGFNTGSRNASSSMIGQLHQGTSRTDPNTGIVFPVKENFPISRPPLSLVGVGTRKKAVLNIYSLGMYVSAPIEKQLSSAASSSSKKTCQTILDSKAHKAVQLTFHMAIGPEKIAEAVSQLAGVDSAVTKEFHDLVLNGMGGGKMKSGEKMSFEWKGADAISVTIRGSVVGEMKDKALANAVLGLYLGPKSVSPSLRKDLGCV